jgi:Mn-containing catalase
MNKRKEVIDEIEAMARHEEIIASLYNAFAENIEGHSDFWNDISLEELGHASLVREFRQKVEEGAATINEGRFKVPAIEHSIKFIKGEVEKARHGWTMNFHALVTAADIENALLENKFLEVFETDDEELRTLLDYLQTSTRDHKKRIEKLLKTSKHKRELPID